MRYINAITIIVPTYIIKNFSGSAKKITSNFFFENFELINIREPQNVHLSVATFKDPATLGLWVAGFKEPATLGLWVGGMKAQRP